VTDGQPRELWICPYPGIACGVEEHESGQCSPAPPPRPVGRPRKLPVVEAGKRKNASGPSSLMEAGGGEGGGQAMDRRSSESVEVTSEEDTNMHE